MIVLGCNSQKTITDDMILNEPKDQNYFNKYKGKIDDSIFNELDTLNVYEYSHLYASNTDDFSMKKNSIVDYGGTKTQFKFYQNGCLYRIIPQRKRNENVKNKLEKGVFKSANSKNQIQFYVYTYSAQTVPNYGIRPFVAEVRKDTLLVKFKNQPTEVRVYVKKELQDNNLGIEHKADW